MLIAISFHSMPTYVYSNYINPIFIGINSWKFGQEQVIKNMFLLYSVEVANFNKC